jgi:hypothetical protein
MSRSHSRLRRNRNRSFCNDRWHARGRCGRPDPRGFRGGVFRFFVRLGGGLGFGLFLRLPEQMLANFLGDIHRDGA